MTNFKKVFISILIAFIFLLQDAGACNAQNHHALRTPVLTNNPKGIERLQDGLSAISSFNGLDDDQRALLMETLPILEEGYLAIEGQGFTRTIDRRKNEEAIGYFKEKGERGFNIIKIILEEEQKEAERKAKGKEKDTRAWVRAKAAMALGELVLADDTQTIEFLLGIASKDSSLLVRSIIIRRILEDIKKHCSDNVKKFIEEKAGKINLNPWSMKDGLRVLEVGCGLGEASHGIAKYYKEKGFSDVVVVGVDNGYEAIINAEKNRTDDSIVFVYGTVDEAPAYFPADIVISQNLLVYRDELKKHAVSLFSQVNKDGGAVYFSPSIFNKSDDSSGSDGIMRLFDMEVYFRHLSENISGAELKVVRGDREQADSFGFDFIKGAFGSPWGASTGWIEASMPSRIKINTQSSSIKLRQSRFPDGEAYLRILNSDVVKDADVVVDCSLNSPQDLVEVVLLMDFLRGEYGAKSVKLSYKTSGQGKGLDNGIAEFLRLFCDTIVYRDNQDVTALDVRPVPILADQEKIKSAWIDVVAYQHQRLKRDAVEAAGILKGAVSRKINIVKDSPNPLNWRITIDDDLKGKNIALLHSTENSVDIAELWMTLVALRKAGVKSVHVFNAYEGYSRQDKKFNEGEGVSALTMLKAIDSLTDSHFALNVHYLDYTGLDSDRFDGIQIYNINAFIQISEHLFDFIAGSLKAGDIAKEFKKHPLLLLGPDDGAFQYIKEAKARLARYITEKYGINVQVHYGYLNKNRISGTEVEMKGGILSDGGEPITGIPDLKDCWVFIIDDETSSGGTLLTATYVLNEQFGVAWHRILTGVAHGKLAMGLEPFETGLTEDAIKQAIERNEEIKPQAEYVNTSKKRMPPRLFVCTSSVRLPDDFPENLRVSIGPNIAHFIKRVVGRNVGQQIIDTSISRTQL